MRHRDREAAAEENGNVGKVVADVGAGRRRQPSSPRSASQGVSLSSRALDHARRLPATRARCITAGALLPVIHATVMPACISSFSPTPSSTLKALSSRPSSSDVDATVGQHAVDVAGEEPDAALHVGTCDGQFGLVLGRPGLIRPPARGRGRAGAARRRAGARRRRRAAPSPWARPPSARRNRWRAGPGPMVRGVRVITSRTRTPAMSCPRSRQRRRSPSVKMPAMRPSASTTAVMPMPLPLIATTASPSVASMPTMGSASPLTITSRTRVSRRRPSGPPGCERAKSSTEKPRASSSASASASPSASVAVVLAVGRETERAGFGIDGGVEMHVGRLRERRLLVAGERDDLRALPLEMRRQQRRARRSRRNWRASRTTSAGVIMPRSPCEASAGWTKNAGVPVEASVAASLRAMWPGLADAGHDHAALGSGGSGRRRRRRRRRAARRARRSRWLRSRGHGGRARARAPDRPRPGRAARRERRGRSTLDARASITERRRATFVRLSRGSNGRSSDRCRRRCN